MNSGHSEKGREFCIRTETCLIDRTVASSRWLALHPQRGLPLVKSSLVHQQYRVLNTGPHVR
ncbi:hypothetical protein LEMLEM_LOCUS3762 [Lemmus lemmus]